MARYEGTTDVPEHAHLAKDTTLNWDLRARGLGGDLELPLTSCAEENLLCYQIDKYHAEDILIHEFAIPSMVSGSCHWILILTICCRKSWIRQSPKVSTNEPTQRKYLGILGRRHSGLVQCQCRSSQTGWKTQLGKHA